MNEILFVAKIHIENGYSFYLPTKLVKWLGLEFGKYNNTVFIKRSSDAEDFKVDCSATQHKDTWKFSFYKWKAHGVIKEKTDYLIRVPIKSVKN